MKILKITKDCVYKIKIEKLDEFEESFFADVYFKSSKSLINIIDSNNEKNLSDDEFNNIISFVGERGTGKTSSMISFKNSLQQLCDINRLSENQELKKNYKKIAENKFYDLDTIDPSVFNGTDSIIEIVVAEMFKKFKAKNEKQDYINKQELVKKFEIVYKDLRTLNKDKNTIYTENLDNLEVLIDLSSAIALRNDIEKLVDSYLKYMKEDKNFNGKSFLTITIDDLDMNIAAGEKMIEDIRKYLIIPQVIIMMAIKFEQLEEVIKQKNIKDLDGLSNYYRNTDELIKNSKREYMTKALDEELNNKTNKYLEKVIPYNKRIYMPEVYGSDAEIEVHLENLDYKEEESIEIFVGKIFYEYLRYTIVTKSHYNVIIPNNLRELVDLILLFSTLEKLEPYNIDNNEIINKKKIINNLTSMKQYFNKVIANKISTLYIRDFLNDLLQCPIQSINKKILLYLNTKLYLLKEIADTEIAKCLEELYKMERRVVEESVTLGDVITWMKLYEDMGLSPEEKVFIEMLKTVYSIRLINEIYIGSEEIVHIIGKDVVGKYFEFTSNKHDQKIEIEVKVENGEIFRDVGIKRLTSRQSSILPKQWVEFSKINESYYSLLEPRYKNEDRYILSKLYRDIHNTVEEKKFLKFFYFKPFNILGVKDKIYKEINKDIDKKANLSIYNDILYVGDRELKDYLSINDYILFLNMDFYMLALNCIDKVLDKRRFRLNYSYNPKAIIELMYNTTETVFSVICDKCSYLKISNPIKNIFEDKDFDFEFIEDNIITKEENSKQTEVDKNIETDTISQMYKLLNRLKKYLRELQKKYLDNNGIKGTISSKFETTIKENYREEITELNNKVSKLNVSDSNNLFENILSLIDEKKQDSDLDKEKIRVDNIIDVSIKQIDIMLEKIKE
ncbi:hypothetical protein psyc5s11_33830 [Clostridium gelidum]|uniref:ATP-binding protein n=1 Tax=Clostridium gelidum TaxID=704125 RepID=A0ABN6IYW2_9CLOT|nr:hypothetical protein [Clostridium gelidum]BCZ47316.1 hypothetical protein psyc5s11_33830 [Clostridium gelidum]